MSYRDASSGYSSAAGDPLASAVAKRLQGSSSADAIASEVARRLEGPRGGAASVDAVASAVAKRLQMAHGNDEPLPTHLETAESVGIEGDGEGRDEDGRDS